MEAPQRRKYTRASAQGRGSGCACHSCWWIDSVGVVVVFVTAVGRFTQSGQQLSLSQLLVDSPGRGSGGSCLSCWFIHSVGIVDVIVAAVGGLTRLG